MSRKSEEKLFDQEQILKCSNSNGFIRKAKPLSKFFLCNVLGKLAIVFFLKTFGKADETASALSGRNYA